MSALDEPRTGRARSAPAEFRATVASPYREASIRHLAGALDRRGRLAAFYAPLDTRPLARVSRLGGRRTAALTAKLSTRAERTAGVAPMTELAFGLATRAGMPAPTLLGWRGRRFDAVVARRCSRSSAAVHVGMPYSSLETFRRAQSVGALCVLNHVNAPLASENRVFEEEAARAGVRAERDEILGERWPAALVARADAEIELANLVLCPSRLVEEALLSSNVPASKLAYLPYGVDVDRFRPSAPDARSRPVRVIYVGQVGVRKGLGYLGEAVRQARRDVDSITVVGPVVNRSRVLERTLQGARHVPLASHGELASLLGRADVFALPSLSEGMALVVLEAMAAGLPVIVTAEAGYDGIVRQGIEGYVVPARDSGAIARALEELAADGERRTAMGAAARARAEQYSWTRYEHAVLECLERGVGEGPA